MIFIKRTIPLIITFITGIIMIVAFFSGSGLPSIKAIEETFPQWIQIIMTFTMILGAISLLRINLAKIARKVDGWGYSLVLVVGFLTMSTLGLLSGSWPMLERNVKAGEQYHLMSSGSTDSKLVFVREIIIDKDKNQTAIVVPVADANKPEVKGTGVSLGSLKSSFLAWVSSCQHILFTGVFKAAQSTMFSLLAFFVASASFRAFRVKSKEAGLLMGSAFIVMLGNVPLGNMLSQSLSGIPLIGQFIDISALKDWILTYPSSAAQSAILIGAMLGYISVSMKVIFGIERSHLGGEG